MCIIFCCRSAGDEWKKLAGSAFTPASFCSFEDVSYDHPTGKVEYVSPNVERVMGVKRDELLAYMERGGMGTDPDARAAQAD